MKKINLDTQTEYEIFVDDLPKFDLIPKELLDIFINSISRELELIIKKKEQRHNYYIASKKEKPP